MLNVMLPFHTISSRITSFDPTVLNILFSLIPPKFIYSALMSLLSSRPCYPTAYLAPLLGYLIDLSTYHVQSIQKIINSLNFQFFWKENCKKSSKISPVYIIFPMLLMSIKSNKYKFHLETKNFTNF